MSNANSISQSVVVVSVEGTLKATDADGNVRVIQPGDTVHPGEVLSSSGGQASFRTPDGQSLVMASGQPFFVPQVAVPSSSIPLSSEPANTGSESSSEESQPVTRNVPGQESTLGSPSSTSSPSTAETQNTSGGTLNAEVKKGLGVPKVASTNAGLDVRNEVASEENFAAFPLTPPEEGIVDFSGGIFSGIDLPKAETHPLESNYTSEESALFEVYPSEETVIEQWEAQEKIAELLSTRLADSLAGYQVNANRDQVAINYSSILNQQTGVLQNDTGNAIRLTIVGGASVALGGSTVVRGDYGSLTVDSDGTYSYVADDIDLHSDLVASWQFDETPGSLVAADGAQYDRESNQGYLRGDAKIVSGGVSGNALSVNTSNLDITPQSEFSNANLLARYTFDGMAAGQSEVIDVIGGRNGTSSSGNFDLGSGASPQGPGHLDLNGDKRLELNDVGLPNTAEDVTVAFWVKLGSGSQMLVNMGNYDLWVHDGKIGFNTWHWDLYGIDISDLQLPPGSPGLEGEWHYISATFHHGDSTQSVLRVDGITQDLNLHPNLHPNTNSPSSYLANIHQDITFGTRILNGDELEYQVNSELDDIKVFEGTFSNSEAETLYQQALGAAPETQHWTQDLEAAFGFGHENESFLDLSANSHTISLSGSAHRGAGHNGHGNAIELDGTPGYAEINDLAIGGPMTIASWVRIDDLSGSWSRIFDFGDGQANNNILLSHNGTSNILELQIYNGQGVVPDAILSVPNFFTEGEWVHITATIDAQGVIKIYKDGTLVGTQNDGEVPALTVRSENFIGKSHWSNDAYLDGAVDDLVVVNRALSASEISQIFQADSVESLLDDGRVNVGNSQEINIPPDGIVEERTITLSFKPEAGNTLNDRQVIYEEGGSSGGFIIYIHNGTLYAGAHSSSSGWPGAFLNADISSLDTSQFHRITLSLDGTEGTLTAWLDGNQIGQSSSAQSVSEHSGQIAIGINSTESTSNTYHDGSQSGRFAYSGLVDDLRIYNRAFTNGEVQSLISSDGELSDSFTYTITDGDGATATASIDISVQRPLNYDPNAVNDVLSVGAGQSASVNSLVSSGLLGNDQDAEGAALTVTHIGNDAVSSTGTTTIQGQFGSLVIAANGTYAYIPSSAAASGGTETFNYTISDGVNSAKATLTVNVLADSFAANDSVSILEQSGPDGMNYVITSGTTLAAIDVESREVTTLGNITGTAPSTSSGHLYLAMVDGQLYALGEDAVYTVDPHSLAATQVATHSISASPSGVAAGPNGMLYATAFDGRIHSIDPVSGTTTQITDSSTAPASFFYDLVELDGSLYTVGYTSPEWFVYRVDIADNETVTATQISPSALTDNPSPLFVQDGQLYGVNGSNELISIDKNSGAVTNLGTASDLNYPADLAYSSDSVVEGNVLSNDTGAQSVTSILDINGNAVTVTSSGTTVQTEFGEINIKSDGSYSYTLNNDNQQVDSLVSGQTANDRFVYTTVNSDGDTAQAVLTVNINGADEVAVAENRLEGDETNNILIGGLDNDNINAGGGNDTLTGGGGIDFFVWHDGDQGISGSPAVDTVTDFNVGAHGDVLDLADLLPDSAAGNLDQYLSFSTSNGSTTVGVSTSAGGPVVQQIVLDDVDLTSVYGTTDTTTLINNLTNDGNLQT